MLQVPAGSPTSPSLPSSNGDALSFYTCQDDGKSGSGPSQKLLIQSKSNNTDYMSAAESDQSIYSGADHKPFFGE